MPPCRNPCNQQRKILQRLIILHICKKSFDKKNISKHVDVDHITSTRIIRNQSYRSLVPHKCISNSSLPKSSTSRKRHVHWHKSSCFRTSRETDEQCFWCCDDFTTMFMTTLNILSAARMVKDIFWLRWRYKRWWTFMSIDGHEFKKFQSINWCMYCMYIHKMDSSKMSLNRFQRSDDVFSLFEFLFTVKATKIAQHGSASARQRRPSPSLSQRAKVDAESWRCGLR